MPKYLVQASYTGEGLKGLMKDKASGRKAAVSAAMASVGGSLEAMYFCFGGSRCHCAGGRAGQRQRGRGFPRGFCFGSGSGDNNTLADD